MIFYFDNVYILAGLTVLFLILAIFLKAVKKKSNLYLLAFLVMYVYVCKVIDLTQFPVYASEEMRAAMGGQNVWKEINLIPFKTIMESFSNDVFLNIIMTMPLGFGLPFLVRCSWKRIAFAGLTAGFLCEAGQLVTALLAGFTFRHVNIDDMLLNFAGTLIGYVFSKIFCHIFYWGYKKLKLSPNALWTFMLNVCDENTDCVK